MTAQVESSNGGQEDDSWVVDSIANFKLLSSSTAKIPKVPTMVKDTEAHYQKNYVPKVVSIGPYHHGNQKLDLVENLKPGFTMKLLLNTENLRSLCTKFEEPNKVQELRNFYEEKSTVAFCNKVFVKMMLLDACFILYYIQHIFGEKFEEFQDLKSRQIVFVRQDLFLLENQIPFEVLDEVMKLMNISREKIKSFIIDNILAYGRRKKRWYESIYSNRSSEKPELSFNAAKPDHLLHLLHLNLTKGKDDKDKGKYDIGNSWQTNRCTFRNVSELMDVGIQFKPSSTMSLTAIKFSTTWWWWFSASVKLPPITVDDSTKPMLLNLIAYELCSHDSLENSWVTSYICLLDSLIDQPEDVKTLRKARVLVNALGSDNEVANLFNEIGTDLVQNNLAYLDAKEQIQRHYESWRNGCFYQLKHEYFKSPWAFFALVGALMALLLSGVQTYYTVWSPKGKCDDLCMFLKMNHHL